MKCDFAEKVSMLIDGELAAAEIEALRAHIAACAECRNLEKDFLFFRQQIKSPIPEKSVVEKAKYPFVSRKKRTRFLRGRISLPVPALALFVIALIGLGGFLIFSRVRRTSIGTATQTPVENIASKTANAPSEVSLARYDAGGRAEIYIAPKQSK